MKRYLMLVLFIGVAGVVLSSNPVRSADEKQLFIQKCGQCHKSGGMAAVFAPSKYASSQWEYFFQRDRHARKKDISGVVTADEQKRILQYLEAHAADSDQPEIIGLR